MQSSGKVIAVLNPQGGTSQSSGKEWKKQMFVIETDGQYQRKQAFYVWNDRTTIPEIGEKVIVDFEIEAREYNGYWYTDVTAWKVTKAEPEQPQQQALFPPAPEDVTIAGNIAEPAQESDDLPF